MIQEVTGRGGGGGGGGGGGMPPLLERGNSFLDRLTCGVAFL